MKLSEREIVEKLLSVDEEFKQLHQQHQSMEKMLADFFGKPYLSPAEQVEVKKIKKKKLQHKDEMYRKIYEFKRTLEV